MKRIPMEIGRAAGLNDLARTVRFSVSREDR